ncbi:spore morphogenesis/germination protein YwcE [Guptibacillus hwajinpoensis]|uniref:Phosphoglycerol transferase MdoB-like AlkP superfamily enzyme n=2 Tax=Guptibacillus hwajinpoensis TaxID=208199 RepID=A0ABU0JYE1_9BACL|nr:MULTISPECIES: spore morphogenesis/germination protein YwcE [Alkalihalobacillus]KMM36487.1 spore gernimation protein [Alkalihalobacillus macyae]MDQ0482147.1 phosphoglycerol transferase MdoB-like AlkP superfamily enzyme [Alkalihalobacillus hemicentroti]
MDVYMVYLFVITATPLFLWQDYRKLALAHIPFIVTIWALLIFYIGGGMTPAAHTLFISLFVINVLFAHLAAYLIFARPFLKERSLAKKMSPTKE